MGKSQYEQNKTKKKKERIKTKSKYKRNITAAPKLEETVERS
jgi:hypothetical protein